jgi:hypothetical protein
MNTHSSRNLKERQGSHCAKCDLVFFSETEKCVRCQEQTQPIKWYSRFIVERLVFTFVAPAVFAGAYVALRGDEAAKNEFGFAGVYLMLVFIVFSFFGGAKTLMGIGGYTERFHEKNLPARAHQTFNLARFLTEFLYFVGVVLAMMLFVGLVALLKWAFSN